jgi:uncharacterized protein (DUF427 family)
VSLSTGRGPLSPDPAGRFSAPLPAGLVYVEPFARRVRAVLDGREVLDSERGVLVHRPGVPPAYAFPAEDVHGVPTEPEPEAPGHVRVSWDAVDAWFEEEDEVHGHPRNPYHRIDILRSSRRLRVELGGTALVDTSETLALFETSLAPRLYVHPDRVAMDHLRPSPTTTHCPYKGTASYWTAVVGDLTVEDVAWSYEDPVPEALPIRGMLSFYAHRADVTADLPTP